MGLSSAWTQCMTSASTLDHQHLLSWLWPVQTSSGQFSLVYFSVHDKEYHCVGLASLQIQNSNNADVLLDSTLKLVDIIANLCSKLYYEVLLKSENYIVNLLKQTLMFRAWIVKFGHPVWMCKLTDIVTSLCSVFTICPSGVNWNVLHVFGISK